MKPLSIHRISVNFVKGFAFAIIMLSLSCGNKQQSENEKQKSANGNFQIEQGVNIAHWLSQSDARGEERRNFFTESDVEYIAELGFDHIRLPIDEEQMWDKEGNKKEEAFQLLHNAIQWCNQNGLKTIVDLHIIRSHHFNKEKRPLWTNPEEQEKFIGLWEDLSGELKKYGNDEVAYELMNEAVAEDPDNWNQLIKKTINSIRKEEPKRKIVVGSNRWQSVHTFDELELPKNDDNLIVSFHFYIPMPITHYKASWTKVGEYEGPVSYPGKIIKEKHLEGLPEDLAATLEDQNGYYNQDTLEKLIKKPVRFAKKHGLPLYCGEWGSLSTLQQKPRLQWYEDVREILEKYDIAWANWNYKSGSFGIVDSDGDPNQELINVLLNR
jgi:endoglucanase